MDRTKNLPRLRDNESEYLLGYVFAVSGPGEFNNKKHMTKNFSLKPKHIIEWKHVSHYIQFSSDYVLTDNVLCVSSGDSAAYGWVCYVRVGQSWTF